MSPTLQILLLSIGLAIDAFSVSIFLGAETKNQRTKNMIIVALTFAFFQSAMSSIGVLVGNAVLDNFKAYTGRIAFVLLLIVALKMLVESRKEAHEKKFNQVSLMVLLTLGIATSIDALIAGTTLTLIEIPLVLSLICIGVVTFILSCLGFIFGDQIGKRFGNNIEIIGAIFLILLGVSFLFK